MLIYELQGFSLTILSFTETERGGEKDRGKAREKQKAGKRERGRQTARCKNRGTLTDRSGGMWGGREEQGREIKFGRVMLL